MVQNQCYIHPMVSKKALAKFLDIFRSGGNELHTLQIYHRNQLLVRMAVPPYRSDDKREVYSLSKSFSSTAIGFLYDEGKVSPEDRLVDLFPDKLPEVVSDNLAKMRLKDVLRMRTGHAECSMSSVVRSDDPVRAFLAREVEHEPGTYFCYDTGASCILSCIVERITGMKMVDYLTPKLFLPLGIHGITWNSVRDGNNEGGCGLHLSSDDIMKFGLLYANKGKWNGRQLLSEDWINQALDFVPFDDSSCAGYGYQFWCDGDNNYRADGAFGQFCLVLPGYDMIFALQECLGEGYNLNQMEVLAEHLLEEDDTATLLFPALPPIGSEQKTAGFENVFYRLEDNPLGWTGIYFIYDGAGDTMNAVFSNGTAQQTITAGNGYYADSTVFVRKMKPKIVNLMTTPATELCPLASSYSAEDGKLTILVRFRNSPNKMTITAESSGDTLTMHLHTGGMLDAGASDLKGYRCT